MARYTAVWPDRVTLDGAAHQPRGDALVEPGKTAVRRAVGREFKRMRNASRLNLAQATVSATRTGSKALMQVERGRNLPYIGDIDALLSTFGHREQIPCFTTLVREANERKEWRDWWERRFPVDFVPEESKLLLSCEASAVELTLYRAQFVPELFQTPEYAAAMIRADRPDLADDAVDRWVELTIGRQHVLDRDEPPNVRCVLDEAVLRRQAGGPEVLRDQLARLAEFADRPTIDIRVLPDSAGAHAGTGGGFTRISALPQLPTYPGIAHVRTAAHDVYYEEPEEIGPFDDVFTRLREAALPARESAALIEVTAGA